MKALSAKHYFSGFELAHDTYDAISCASDGKIYYVLCSESYEVGGQVHVFNPETDTTTFLANLNEICDEKDATAVPQGKSHVRFYESQGKLYFATHVGVYQNIGGMERIPQTPPNGLKLYPGGHLLSYDLANGQFEDLGIPVPGEGVLTMTMDTIGQHIYLISWPTGQFIHYDVKAGVTKNLGPVSLAGDENGTPGEDYRVFCRSMFVDPRDSAVYFSTCEGDIYTYRPNTNSIRQLQNVSLRLDYFGNYDPTQPGSMGYNWRKIFWYEPEQVAYGVHGNSGYLFRFDPTHETIEIVERITSEPSRKSGMYDQFSYGYLGFHLNTKNDTIYYLTGGPIYENGKRVKGADSITKGAARGLENLHLITFCIKDQKYEDHGPVFYENGDRPTYVNSIAIGANGHVYTLARFLHNDKEIQDLIKIEDPFSIS